MLAPWSARRPRWTLRRAPSSSRRYSKGSCAGPRSGVPVDSRRGRCSARASCASAYRGSSRSQYVHSASGATMDRSMGPPSRVSDHLRLSSCAITSGTRPGRSSPRRAISAASYAVPLPFALNQQGTLGRLESDGARPGPGMRLLPLAGKPAATRRELGANPGPGFLDECAARPQRRRIWGCLFSAQGAA